MAREIGTLSGKYDARIVEWLRFSTPMRWQYQHPMIREANESDIPRITEMGSRSLREGPYKDLVADKPEETGKLALQVIQKGLVLVSEEDEKLTGLLAFIIFPHYFSGELTAGEVMWYVEPEYRATFTAICLLLCRRTHGARLWSEIHAIHRAHFRSREGIRSNELQASRSQFPEGSINANCWQG